MKKENMNFKTLDLAISDEIEGKVEAVFSVINTVDSDEDVVLPNSIKSAWGQRRSYGLGSRLERCYWSWRHCTR